MAEYVRRRRPPADHPYWDRLQDRAHPPAVWRPILIASILGLASGLYGGLKGPFTIAEATKLAGLIAGTIGVLAFLVMLLVLILDAARQLERHQRWPMAIMGGSATCVAMFVISFVPLAAVFIVYSLSTHYGPWVGMLIGFISGSAPTAAMVLSRRARWRDRQRQWPRWDRMRARRRRSSRSGEAAGSAPDSPPSERASAATSPPIPNSSSENVDPQVGESNGPS